MFQDCGESDLIDSLDEGEDMWRILHKGFRLSDRDKRTQ